MYWVLKCHYDLVIQHTYNETCDILAYIIYGIKMRTSVTKHNKH